MQGGAKCVRARAHRRSSASVSAIGGRASDGRLAADAARGDVPSVIATRARARADGCFCKRLARRRADRVNVACACALISGVRVAYGTLECVSVRVFFTRRISAGAAAQSSARCATLP